MANYDSTNSIPSDNSESAPVSPSPEPSSGIGSIVITPPQGMDIPDEGTITIKYKKVPAEAEAAEPTDGDAPGDIELDVQSVVSVEPVDDGSEAPTSRSAAFDQTAKSVRGA